MSQEDQSQTATSIRRLRLHSSKLNADASDSVDTVLWIKKRTTGSKGKSLIKMPEHQQTEQSSRENTESNMSTGGNMSASPSSNTESIQQLTEQEAMELTLDKWWQMFQSMNTNLNTLNARLQNLEGKEDNDSIMLQTSLANRVNVLEESLKQSGIKQRIMANIIINQDEQIQSLQAELKHANRQRISKNIVIEGIIEPDGETRSSLIDLVKVFMRESMLIPKDVLTLGNHQCV